MKSPLDYKAVHTDKQDLLCSGTTLLPRLSNMSILIITIMLNKSNSNENGKRYINISLIVNKSVLIKGRRDSRSRQFRDRDVTEICKTNDRYVIVMII